MADQQSNTNNKEIMQSVEVNAQQNIIKTQENTQPKILTDLEQIEQYKQHLEFIKKLNDEQQQLVNNYSNLSSANKKLDVKKEEVVQNTEKNKDAENKQTTKSQVNPESQPEQNQKQILENKTFEPKNQDIPIINQNQVQQPNIQLPTQQQQNPSNKQDQLIQQPVKQDVSIDQLQITQQQNFPSIEETKFVVINCIYCEEQDLNQLEQIEMPEDKKNFYCCESCLKKQIEKGSNEIQKLNDEFAILQQRQNDLRQDIKLSTEANPDKELEIIQKEEEKMKQEISKLNQNKEQQLQFLEKLKLDVLQLETKEQEYWNEINQLEKKLYKVEEKSSLADSYLETLNEEVDRINHINVLNEVFSIFCDEQTGTINNLKIGKKIDSNIDWDELNAGLGQISILFTYLFSKYKYKTTLIESFECLGSMSRIREYQKKEPLNLFGPLKERLEEEKFNRAIILLLKEFANFSEKRSQSQDFLKRKIVIDLPHKIHDEDLIDDLHLNTLQYKEQKWDKWTTAFKYFLTNIKYIITINCVFESKLEEEFLTQL